MKWIVSLLSILILILLQSCSQNQSSSETHSTEAAKVLDINNIKINNTEPALSVSEVIKLETVGNKALINQISKIIRYDKQLYILTQVPQNGVFIFSDNGVFNCKIPKGRANNELLYPMHCARRKHWESTRSRFVSGSKSIFRNWEIQEADQSGYSVISP